MNRSEISTEIEKVEQQLSELREKLKKSEPKTPREAKIGDELDDGSIVVETYPNAILVVSPKETEHVINSKDVRGGCNLSFESAYCKFDYSYRYEWFAPSLEILESSMRKVPEAFNKFEHYISTTKTEYYISTTKIELTTQGISDSDLIQHGFVVLRSSFGLPSLPWRYFYNSRDLKCSPEFKIHQRLFRFIAF